MQKADLHIHTNASDGLLSPEEIVKWASCKSLRAIAITDHDTINGIEQAKQAETKYNIEVIPGIELSTEYDKEEIHILGYYINYKEDWLNAILRDIRESRYQRAEKMIQKLNTLGFNITIKHVEKIANNGTLGRPHIARALMEKGYINNIKIAFDEYIGKNCPAYVERYKISCEDAIDLIFKIGGVPVLAHPGLIKNKKNINLLIDMGIRGIEVYHSKHDGETTRNMLQIANARKLIITGGTDCHGIMMNNEPILGNIWVDYKYVKQLQNEAKGKKY